jgi:hypothetical protein
VIHASAGGQKNEREQEGHRHYEQLPQQRSYPPGAPLCALLRAWGSGRGLSALSGSSSAVSGDPRASEELEANRSGKIDVRPAIMRRKVGGNMSEIFRNISHNSTSWYYNPTER